MRVGELTTAGARREPRSERLDEAREAPLVLGRYRLGRALGAGSFGTVWLGYDERLEREVAIKMLPLARIVGGRFEREARVAAKLSHPAIVTLYEAAADESAAYIVSELVRGTTLERALEAGRLSDRDVLAIGSALCDALTHAHAHAIVHRDVKPSNVLIPAHPVPGAPAKLTDFGVARVVGGDALTVTGELVGTAAYMAPEQAEGREAGEAADLYSLAVVLYEALTGINPVPVGVRGQRPRRLALYLPPVRRTRRDLPRELGQAIDLALRPRPRERGTVAELRAALERAGQVLAAEEAYDRPGRGDQWVRGGRGHATAATANRPTSSRAGAERVGADPADPAGPADPANHANRDPAHPPPPQSPRPGPQQPGAQQHQPGPPLPARALGAAVTAGAAAWAAAGPLAPIPFPPATAALAAGLAVLVAPRLGWILLAVASAVVLCVHGQPGAVLVLAPAALLPVALLPHGGAAWPLAALAPALGAVGLAGAWPALAARARTTWRRAALGALGWTWLWVAAVLAGRDLYAHRPAGTPPPAVWTDSPFETVHHVLASLPSAGLIGGALVWAAGAAVLPSLRGGRSVRRDAVAVGAWSLGVCLGISAALALGGTAVPAAHVVLAGALVGAAAALAPAVAARIGGRRGRIGSEQGRIRGQHGRIRAGAGQIRDGQEGRSTSARLA